METDFVDAFCSPAMAWRAAFDAVRPVASPGRIEPATCIFRVGPMKLIFE